MYRRVSMYRYILVIQLKILYCVVRRNSSMNDHGRNEGKNLYLAIDFRHCIAITMIAICIITTVGVLYAKLMLRSSFTNTLLCSSLAVCVCLFLNRIT